MGPLGKYAECRFAGCASPKGETRKYSTRTGDTFHLAVCEDDAGRIRDALAKGYAVNRTPGGDIWIDNLADILEGR